MSSASTQEKHAATMPAASAEIMGMIVANACPHLTIQRICAMVQEVREDMQAVFIEHDISAANSPVSRSRPNMSIPVHDEGERVVGTLYIHAEGECDPSDTDCQVIRYVVQLIQLVIARRHDRESARKERERARAALQRTMDAIVTTDADGVIDYVNPSAEDLLNSPLRCTVGLKAAEVMEFSDGVSDEACENPISLSMRSGRVVTIDENAVLACRDGKPIPVQGSASPLRNAHGDIIGSVLVCHDVSTFARIARQLAYQAAHDPLTGLANRAEFEKLVVDCIDARSEDLKPSAILQIDIDQLKVVNDTYGHVVGDELLRQVSEVIQNHVRSTDLVARLSGDEFGVLIHDHDKDGILAMAEAIRRAVELHRFSWRDAIANVRCSIGVVMMNGDDDSAALLGAADVACYSAKKLGRNQIYLYSDLGQTPQHEEMKWVSRITSAIEEERFEIHYQPIVRLSDTETPDTGHHELLIRMRDEEGKLVLPSSFIPAAEHYNLMPQLDRWVIRTACEHHSDRSASDEQYALGVNLSGKSLSDDRFLEFVLRELKRHALRDGAICFEITETAAISDLSRVVYFIRSLRKLGCRFALDDFGSGLSSFAYLKCLPVDYLKIDGHFVSNMLQDQVDACTVQAISQVARSIGIETVAEGVESKEVLDKLRDIGIDYAQGFYLARPAPMQTFDPGRHYL